MHRLNPPLARLAAAAVLALAVAPLFPPGPTAYPPGPTAYPPGPTVAAPPDPR